MRRFAIWLYAAVVSPVPADAGDQAPRFVDRASALGITHQYTGGWEHFVGGGVATFDCNGDGFPEIFAAGGASPSSLFLNRTGGAGSPLSFEQVSFSSSAETGVTGAYPIDIDSDGEVDLAVMRVGENRLFKGDGKCGFKRANDIWGFEGRDRWTTAFSATWEKGQVFPSLVFANYVDRDDPEGPFFACDDNALYRPDGHRYGEVTLLTPGYCALSVLFSDWGRHGRQDLRISNDRHYYVRNGSEQLWRMEMPPQEFSAQDGWQSLSIWGMGIASRDISGDGLPEVFLTSMGDQKLRFLAEGGDRPTYKDASYNRGTTAHIPFVGDEGRPSSGWHAAFGDIDNDGRDDLFVAKGNVDQMPDAAMRDPNNLLMQQADGRFVEFADKAGIATTHRARGAAVVDLNRDGRLDIVVNNRRAGLEIHENLTTAAGNWLSVEIRQTGHNRDGIGAWLELTDGNRTWHRESTIGGGHAGGSLGAHHFGIGQAKELRLRIFWPDGRRSDWHPVQANRHVRLQRNTDRTELRIVDE